MKGSYLPARCGAGVFLAALAVAAGAPLVVWASADGILTDRFEKPLPRFYRDANGVTIRCPEAEIGETGVVDGVIYTKRNREQVAASAENASTACTSGITDMSLLFSQLQLDADISHWDTSSVTDMSGMFAGANSFNQPLDSWDVSSVGLMYGMFADALSFNQDLSAWCVQWIPERPLSFDDGAIAWTAPRPLWGTCPQRFFLDQDGVTVRCDKAGIGEQGTIGGMTYTKRSSYQITPENAAATWGESGTPMICGKFPTISRVTFRITWLLA